VRYQKIVSGAGGTAAVVSLIVIEQWLILGGAIVLGLGWVVVTRIDFSPGTGRHRAIRQTSPVDRDDGVPVKVVYDPYATLTTELPLPQQNLRSDSRD
jgi:hypothetical protein